MSSKTKRLGTLADIYRSENLDGAIQQIPRNRIRPSAEQPRQNRTVGVDELAASLKKDGLLTPVIVTKEKDHYRIIAGERRYHAASKLNWENIECRIISRQEQDYWRIAIIENLQRENLSAEEEASALMRLKKQDKLSDAKVAELVGKSRNYVTEILGIAQLPEKVLKQCQEYGINQYNMLIQVVQAFRKDNLDLFLQKYKTGSIRTVRSARLFNQKKGTPQPQPASSSFQAKKKASTKIEKSFHIRLHESTITVQCPGSEEAQQILIKIRTLLNSLK